MPFDPPSSLVRNDGESGRRRSLNPSQRLLGQALRDPAWLRDAAGAHGNRQPRPQIPPGSTACRRVCQRDWTSLRCAGCTDRQHQARGQRRRSSEARAADVSIDALRQHFLSGRGSIRNLLQRNAFREYLAGLIMAAIENWRVSTGESFNAVSSGAPYPARLRGGHRRLVRASRRQQRCDLAGSSCGVLRAGYLPRQSPPYASRPWRSGRLGRQASRHRAPRTHRRRYCPRPHAPQRSAACRWRFRLRG